MLAVLSNVVRNIVILIFLVTILEMMLPRREFRPFVNMVVGLVLMLMLLVPLRSLLQLPGVLEPVLEIRDALTENAVAERQAQLEELNWELTLTRYRQLVEEKVAQLLLAADLELVSLELQVEEEVNHLEFGVPRQLTVVAQPRQQSAGLVEPVEPVKVEVGAAAGQLGAKTGVLEAEYAAQIAAALGIAAEIVEVRVLYH